MNNEHAPTGGEGVPTDDATAVSGERELADEDLDVLFGILADGRRRRILAYLDGRDDDVATFAELVEHVAGESADDGDRVAASDDTDRVAMQLHHVHIPRMADADLVEYDARSRTVRYRGGQAVSDWLALVRSYGPDV